MKIQFHEIPRTVLCITALMASGTPYRVYAQSADIVLCDRVAADPSDPDKPADVRGAAVIAPSDVPTAIKFCRQASANRRAMYALGRAYAANNQPAEAAAAYRKAAEKGSTSAMVELGVSLAASDPEQARKLFERAAQAGNPRGVTNLAALSGGSVSANPAQARAMLAKTAETNAESQYQLGIMMAEGVGGPKDEVAARNLFQKAAAQNHPGALERMGAFAQSGRGGPQDSAAAKSYYQRAADLGDQDAKAALKRMDCPIVIKDKRGGRVTDLCF